MRTVFDLSTAPMNILEHQGYADTEGTLNIFMENLVAATVQVGQWKWELTPLTAILGAIFLVIYIVAAYDGMKFVFRGTRDYMSLGHDSPTIMARIGGTVAAISVFLSGGVLLVAIVGWIAGAGFFTQKPIGPKARNEREMDKLSAPPRSQS